MMMTWPNIISFGRLCATPLIVWLLLTQQFLEALILFVIAGFSDLLDGYVARALQLHSTLGIYLDALADKILLVSISLTLWSMGYLPSWLVFLIFLRDFFIILGAVNLRAIKRAHSIRPLFISKINTLVQITVIAWLLIELGLNRAYPDSHFPLFFLAGMTTVASGLSYFRLWLNNARLKEGT